VLTPPSNLVLFCSKPVVEMKQCAPLLLELEAVLATEEAQSNFVQDFDATAGNTFVGKGEREEGSISETALQCSVDTNTSQAHVKSIKLRSEGLGAARSSSALCELNYVPCNPVQLPPDSLCAITLPNVYAAPLAWLASNIAAQESACATGAGDSLLRKSGALLPVTPLRANWPFSARLLKGTLLYPEAI
jgi:hypothetical protein